MERDLWGHLVLPSSPSCVRAFTTTSEDTLNVQNMALSTKFWFCIPNQPTKKRHSLPNSGFQRRPSKASGSSSFHWWEKLKLREATGFPKVQSEKLSLKASSSGSKVRVSRTLKIKAGRNAYCLLSPIPLQFPAQIGTLRPRAQEWPRWVPPSPGSASATLPLIPNHHTCPYENRGNKDLPKC